jgi:hypothetical protein
MDRPNRPTKPPILKPKPSAHDLLKDLIFHNADGTTDLSTNPQYMEEFGLDRAQRSKPS